MLLLCGLYFYGFRSENDGLPSPQPKDWQSVPGSTPQEVVPLKERRTHPPVVRNSTHSVKKVSSRAIRWEGLDDTGDPVVYDVEGESLGGAVQAIRGDVQRCFQDGIDEDDITGGQVTFAFTVEKRKGNSRHEDLARVTEVRVEDTTIASDMVEACVMRTIGRLSFEPPSNPVEVVLPFALVDSIHEG